MDFAQQLKASIDIVGIIGQEVRLNKVGRRYRGLCPFHTEKTPSFYVSPDTQFFKCFGCQAGGDVIKFIMEMHGLSFWEALKLLAERHGIPLPKRSEQADEETKRREVLHRMNELAQKHFRSQLQSTHGAAARAYLAGRGVSAESAEQFGLGLTDRAGSTLTQRLVSEGFTPEQLESSGLVIQRDSGGFFDRFRGRLMFPIHNETGKVVGFAGRALAKDDEPKYLNSPETGLYKKQLLLYNLHRARDAARKQGRIILVEGYMDVIGLWAGGIQEVVASCGTALTHNQVKLMKRHADLIVVNFDPDTAGSNAAERSIHTMLEEHAHIRMLELDQDLDPDEYIKQFGRDVYLNLLAKAPAYYLWLADRARQKFDARTAEGRTKAMQFLLPVIQKIPDRIERAGVADDIASFLGVERGILLEEFKRAATDRREKTMRPQQTALPAADVMLVKAMILVPGLRAELVPAIAGLALGQRARMGVIFEAIAGLFRSNPLFNYGDLDQRLEENGRALLHQVFFADEDHEADNLEAVRANALNCLRKMEADLEQARLADLRHRVKEAQRNGDMELALKLIGEIDNSRGRGSRRGQ